MTRWRTTRIFTSILNPLNQEQMSDFVKRTDEGFATQLDNFAVKLPNYATLLGLSAVEIGAVQQDAQIMGGVVGVIEQAKTYSKSWVAYKDLVRNGGAGSLSVFPIPVTIPVPPPTLLPGVEDRFRLMAKRIKGSTNYTTAIGEDLGIEVPESTTDLKAPVLTVKADAGKAVISFKKGLADGVRIYGKRGSETAFTFLAIDTKSPYVDNRPNAVEGVPEKREYYAYLFDDDATVGDQSTIVGVTL
jgi:hypothetical protein